MTLFAFACISGCTTGSAVVTGQERSPIDPAAVRLYDDPPADYEVVGIVEAATDVYFLTTDEAQERTFAELRKQAAEIGANGVIEWEVGEIRETSFSNDVNTGQLSNTTYHRVTVKGTAIYVTSNSRSE